MIQTAPTIEAPALPGPGLHPFIPSADYHSLPFVNASFLNTMYRQTPAHAMADRMAGRTETSAMKLGTGSHAFLLEPDRIETTYVVSGRCEGIKGDGDRCSHSGIVGFKNPGSDESHWYCGTHCKKITGKRDERIVLTQEEYDCCVGMRTAIMSHPYAKLLVEKSNYRECVIIWDDPETGVRCKARLDMLCKGLGIIPDLKTTDELSGRKFYWKAQDLGYFRQCAMYRRACASLGIEIVSSPIIAVESKPGVILADGKTIGHACRVFAVDEDTLKLSDHQIGRLLAGYAECQQSGIWPAYGDNVEEFGLTQADFRRLSTEEI